MSDTVFFDATQDSLNAISQCHESAFPDSLSTKFGRSYLIRMYEWYLADKDRFLYYTGSKKNCTGFCGGILKKRSAESGSSSSMAQFTMGVAIVSILKRPWILIHREILGKLPFIMLNIFNKIQKKMLSKNPSRDKVIYKEPHVGLVVIGVSSEYQGKGIGSQLLIEFENKAQKFGFNAVSLAVKNNNSAALKSYKRNGWQIQNEFKDLYILGKSLKNSEN